MTKNVSWSNLVWAAFLIAFMIGSGVYSVHLGADGMWDLQNYHLYVPFAAIHQRYLFDIAPAQLQTYLNPLLDYPFYILVSLFNDRPRLIAFVMGSVQGINLLAISLIAWSCLRRLAIKSLPGRIALTALATIIGATGGGTTPLIGTNTGDLSVATPVLLGLFFFLRSLDRAGEEGAGNWDLWIAGILAGFALGAKPTMGVYGLAMVVAILVAPMPRIFLSLVRFGFASAVGMILGGGVHAWRMISLFGSPLFPMMNTTFRSPWFEITALRDVRFLPKSFLDALIYPFKWALSVQHGIVTELDFRDIRIALIYALGVLVLGVWAARRLFFGRRPSGAPVPPSIRALIAFGITSYIVWLLVFGIYRYLLPLEMLSGVYIVLALGALAPRGLWTVAAAGAAFACYVTTVPLEWGHTPFQDRYVAVKAPPIAPDTLVAIVGMDPVSYIIPMLPPETRWISLFNNFLRPEQHNLLLAREHRIVADHKGPVMVLKAGPLPPGTFESVLKDYALAVNDATCQTVSSNIVSDTHQLCSASKLDH